MTHEELTELVPLAALDAAGRDEQELLDSHLGTCPTCRTELAAFRETVGWMGIGVAAISPPVELRARILESAFPPRRAGRALSERFAFAAASGSLALIVALGMYIWGMTARLSDLEATLADERDVAAFLVSPDTAIAVLTGIEEAPKARLKLAYDRRTGRALLFGFDLPPLPAEKAYQIWFITAGKPFPGRVFTPDATGRGVWSDRVPAEGRDASVFAVTLEPAGGVSTLGGPIVLKSVSVS